MCGHSHYGDRMNQPGERTIVERFATALDNDEYGEVTKVLAHDVVYEVKGEVLIGPELVANSYREASEAARRIFDLVRYDHEVLDDDGSTFRVKFLDILVIDDDRLVHNAEQLVTVDPDLEVVRIINVDIPAETAKVDEFLAKHGRSR